MARHTKRHIRHYVWFPVVVICSAVGAVFWSVYASDLSANTATQFGATFSTKYSRELGLDWPQVYLALLDDLGVQRFRIPVYWDEVEHSQGEYDLSGIQWMLDEANKHDADVMLVVGQRVPRWPECHPPQWTAPLDTTEIQNAELQMIERVVTTFRAHPALTRWQVQNEPFFSVFGECAPPDEQFIQQSVALVRSLDSTHPIVVTDSGELSTWNRAAALGDVLGISMYRVTWNSFWGYFYYPIPPLHYQKKAEFIASLVDDVIVTELQVEPWVPATILTTPLDEQYRSMDMERMKNNIRFARRTGFSEVYVWGVEWWYWLRERHDVDEYWNEGRNVFSDVFTDDQP